MRAADGAFVPLADVLWPQHLAPVVSPVDESSAIDGATAIEPPKHAPVTGNVGSSEPKVPSTVDPWHDVARDVRVFQARLHDAFDAALHSMLRDVAYAVLGRELLLAESDVATIAERVLAEHRDARPLRVRVAPADVANVVTRASGLPEIVADAALASGDVVVEFADVAIDARFGTRLAVLLDELG